MPKKITAKIGRKNWWKMSDAEREAEWKEIDGAGEIPLSSTRPPTATEVAAVCGRGRPKLGGVGAKHVNVTFEPTLLSRTDEFARRKGMSRSALVSLALEKLMRAG